MRIALDAMGGDFAPDPNIIGAFEAVERLPHIQVLLVGDRTALETGIARIGSLPSSIRIVESEGVVGMEEKPTEALRISIVRGTYLYFLLVPRNRTLRRPQAYPHPTARSASRRTDR